MGQFIYASGERFSVDDHPLLHIQVAAERLFQDGRGFMLTFANPTPARPVRLSFWMHPSIAVTFVYDEGDIDFDPELAATYVVAATGHMGLSLATDDNPPFVRRDDGFEEAIERLHL